MREREREVSYVPFFGLDLESGSNQGSRQGERDKTTACLSEVGLARRKSQSSRSLEDDDIDVLPLIARVSGFDKLNRGDSIQHVYLLLCMCLIVSRFIKPDIIRSSGKTDRTGTMSVTISNVVGNRG